MRRGMLRSWSGSAVKRSVEGVGVEVVGVVGVEVVGVGVGVVGVVIDIG